MLILRIRKAEFALRDGRLDEALQQALRPDVRDHYRGQRLIASLVPAYVARGEKHLASGDHALALADLERAFQLGGNQPQIMQLRAVAQAAVRDESRRRQQQLQQLQEAKRLVKDGDFSLGEAMCEGVVGAETHVAGIVEDVQLRRRSLTTALERARQALSENDFETAVVQAEQIANNAAKNAEATRFLSELLQRVAEHSRDLIVRGRLDQALAIIERCGSLAQGHLQLSELSAVIGRCNAAAAVVDQFQAHTLTQRLKTLRQMVGPAEWLEQAITSANELVIAIDQLRSGPLSLLSNEQANLAYSATMAMPRRSPQNPVARRVGRERSGDEHNPVALPNAAEDLADGFRLHIDGAGSFLVFRKSIVSFGPLSRSRPSDIAFQAPSETPRLTLTRTEDDYFLHSDEAITVNDRLVRDRLMHDGDRISLGRRVALRFRKPNAASSTAVMELGSTTRSAPTNVRRVLLMDEAFVIGPQSTSHIIVPHAESPVIVSWRDGRLQVHRQHNSPTPILHPAVGIVLQPHRPVAIDGISVVAVPVLDPFHEAHGFA